MMALGKRWFANGFQRFKKPECWRVFANRANAHSLNHWQNWQSLADSDDKVQPGFQIIMMCTGPGVRVITSSILVPSMYQYVLPGTYQIP